MLDDSGASSAEMSSALKNACEFRTYEPIDLYKEASFVTI